MSEDTTKVEVAEVISVGEFAELLGKGPAAVVGELMKNGVMATINGMTGHFIVPLAMGKV